MKLEPKTIWEILGFIGLSTMLTYINNISDFLVGEGLINNIALWLTIFSAMVLTRWFVLRRHNQKKLTNEQPCPPNISFSYTLNEDDCYLDPKQSCEKSFSHAVAWEHDEDDDGNLNVYSHSVALVFIQPRNVTKVELKSLNTNDELEIIVAHVESCSDHKKHSGVNVLCNEDVGIERLKLTVYFDD